MQNRRPEDSEPHVLESQLLVLPKASMHSSNSQSGPSTVTGRIAYMVESRDTMSQDAGSNPTSANNFSFFLSSHSKLQPVTSSSIFSSKHPPISSYTCKPTQSHPAQISMHKLSAFTHPHTNRPISNRILYHTKLPSPSVAISSPHTHLPHPIYRPSSLKHFQPPNSHHT